MNGLLDCLRAQNLPVPTALTLWLALATLLALLLGVLYGFLLLRSRPDWLENGFERLDARLQAWLPRPWRFLKSRFSTGQLIGLELTVSATLIVGLIALFAEILESWSEGGTFYQVDQATHCTLEGVLQGRWLDLFSFITHFADVLTLVIFSSLLLCFLLWRRWWWQALSLFLAIALGQALLWSLKWLFARPRPEQPLMDAVGQSFPSGHSFSAMVFYGFLLLLLWQFCLSRALRLAGSLLLIGLILAIGTSRLLLSVHWLSDVVGGFAIGLAWLLVSLLLSRAWFAWRGQP